MFLCTPSLSFCLIFLFFCCCYAYYIPDSNPLLGFGDQVRETHLYTENKRQSVYLEIDPDGTVRGTPFQTANSVLELRSVRAGETVIRGVSSSLYLCIDETGHLRGKQVHTDADCTFKEYLSNGYTRFESLHHRHTVSLTTKRSQDNPVPPLSQFLPVKNMVFSQEKEDGKQENVNIDSEDLFGITLKDNVLSLEFNSNQEIKT